MLVPFDTLPSTSRTWIYQASRIMTNVEADAILNQAEHFVTGWTAHQANLKAGVKIMHNIFLVFAVDESHNDASGCSIDKKTHFIKEIEKQTGIDFFDRMRIAYIENDKVEVLPLKAFASKVNDGTLSDETIIFNNLIYSIGELNNSWQQPVKDSWIRQYIHINSN